MSKFLYVIYNDPAAYRNEEHLKSRFSNLFNQSLSSVTFLSKENKSLFIINRAPNTIVSENLDYCISFPDRGVDKFYLSIKNTNGKTEVQGDAAGTRLVWYYLDKSKLILSSSQQMIVAALGNFEPNEQAWSWMLANGTTGPGLSWDARLKALAAGAKLTLTIKEWQLNVELSKTVFDYADLKEEIYLKELSGLLENIKSDYFLDKQKSLLTLSGGYDSRAALYLLKDSNDYLHTATWGVPSSFTAPYSDAAIAAAVSKAWHTDHSEHNVQLLNNFEDILQKYLMYTEGRNDHINSFMDGLSMWKDIAAQNFKYVVRADEAFGWLPVRTELDARTSVAMAKFSDFKNMPASVIASLPPLVIPVNLERRENEVIEDYRDRIYQDYRLPFVIGALQDGPLTFLEFINPLLHPDVLKFVKRLPPKMRTGKKLYATWVDKLLPDIPYAKTPSIPESYDIVQSPVNATILTEFINDKSTSDLLGQEFVTFIKQNFKIRANNLNKTASPLKVTVKKIFPAGLKKLVRNKITGYEINIGSLVLRSYIICSMQKLMKESAQ